MLLLPWALLLTSARAYNLDVRSARIFKDPSSAASTSRGSYFGFSVALWSSGNEAPVLLVGAPRANSTIVGAHEPGAVYLCLLDRGCTEWTIDRRPDEPIPGLVGQKRDNAWLGATLLVDNSTHPRIAVNYY